MAMSHGINQTLGEVIYKNITDGTCIPKEPVPLPDGLKYFLLPRQQVEAELFNG